MNFFKHLQVLLCVEAIALFVFHGLDLGEIFLPKAQGTGWNTDGGGGFAYFHVFFFGVVFHGAIQR